MINYKFKWICEIVDKNGKTLRFTTNINSTAKNPRYEFIDSVLFGDTNIFYNLFMERA